MGCCNKPKKVWIAKEEVSLWKFSKNSEPETKFFPKGTEFIFSDTKHDYSKEKYWRLKPKSGLAGRFTGFASRFYFYPKNFDIPEEQSNDYFGELKRQDAKELLLSNERNGNGSYLLRIGRDDKFVLSMKYMNQEVGQWDVEHFRIKRANGINGEYYLENNSPFISLEDLIAHYRTNTAHRKDMPTNLTHACFLPNPDADEDFRNKQKIKQGDAWIIPRDEIGEKIKKVGSGNFGEVNLRKWKEKPVAVKELKGFNNKNEKAGYEKEAKTFEREMKIMKKLNHPNLVSMYGICNDKHPYYIVMEYCEHGALKNYLEKFKEKTKEKMIDKKKSPPEFSELKEWCEHISSGMAYLEQLKIIHKDLAARNVMLTEFKRAKVGDFGLSKPDDDDDGSDQFPLNWSAPEVVTSRRAVLKSDVWSFGITMWEIFSFGDKPFGNIGKRNIKKKLGEVGSIPLAKPFDYLNTRSDPDRSSEFQYLYDNVMCKCWKHKPEDRPTFDSLHDQLSGDTAIYYSRPKNR